MKTMDAVVVNHNSTDFAMRALSSIEAHANGAISKIVVMDNASCDRPERIEQCFHGVQVVRNQENLGYSRAINMALQLCSTDYVVIMNPDTVVLNGFFNEALDYLERYKSVGILGPKILDPDGSVQGSARRFPTILSYGFGRKSPITKLFPNNSITRREFMCFERNGDGQMTVDWVSGACMVVRRRAFDEVGGFDERFFLYWEDTDFCRQVLKAGWRTVYFPKAEVKHAVGVSSGKSPVRSICHFHFSCHKLFMKHAKGFTQLLAPFSLFALAARCLVAILLNLVSRKVLSGWARPPK